MENPFQSKFKNNPFGSLLCSRVDASPMLWRVMHAGPQIWIVCNFTGVHARPGMSYIFPTRLKLELSFCKDACKCPCEPTQRRVLWVAIGCRDTPAKSQQRIVKQGHWLIQFLLVGRFKVEKKKKTMLLLYLYKQLVCLPMCSLKKHVSVIRVQTSYPNEIMVQNEKSGEHQSH